MLYLAGTGISEKGMPLDAIDACKRSSRIYIDTYTSRISPEKLSFLQRELGAAIMPLGRSQMEEKSGALLEQALGSDVAVLVGGDPMIATTHKILFINARKRGIMVRVFHAGSVIDAAIGESGLDFYRFGPFATVPRWTEHYKPVSFYETVLGNRERNLHTLLLLDYDAAMSSSIPVSEAARTMAAAEQQYGKGALSDSSAIFILSNLGQAQQGRMRTTVKGAAGLRSEEGQSVVIVPARLSEIEEETLGAIFG